ncbi:hypothetical protein EC957_010829 [Mortierella hygrophila]|uniref:Uncharacterized protein n=1 Tax=Mortierella hygrophila TaxID=979708 RepID=A0A9P6FIU2_9FUNG|nr:hypothetical protein EC957_010829 [Mortierella hygrophila]
MNGIKTITTTTDGVTIATATTTTTSTVGTATTRSDCLPLIEPLKDSIRNSLLSSMSSRPSRRPCDPLSKSRIQPFQAVYEILDQITKESADLDSCTGVKADCTELVVLSGHVIKIGVPIFRAYLTFKFPPAALACIVLQPTIDAV